MRWMFISAGLFAGALVGSTPARACSCGGAPWIAWTEPEIPVDYVLPMSSCWEDSGLEMLRVRVDGVPAEFVVDETTTGEGYLGVRIEPAPTVGQQIVIESCFDDCGDPGVWSEDASLTVVPSLDLGAPAGVEMGELTHASGEFQPGCEILGFEVSTHFEAEPTDHVMYVAAVGLEGQAPLFTKYERVMQAPDGVVQHRLSQYFIEAASLGVAPEDLCATVTVHDFAGGQSAPTIVCGSTPEPGDGDGDGDGTGGDETDGGSDSGLAGDDGDAGCGCAATSPDPGPAALWGLPALWLAASRRRRGRR